MALRASETIIVVADLDVAIGFYTESLGGKLTKREDWGFASIRLPGNHRVGLCIASAFAPSDSSNTPQPPRIGLQSTDIVADLATLASQGVKVPSPSGQAGSIRHATVRDPDGNLLFIWDDGSGKFEAS